MFERFARYTAAKGPASAALGFGLALAGWVVFGDEGAAAPLEMLQPQSGWIAVQDGAAEPPAAYRF